MYLVNYWFQLVQEVKHTNETVTNLDAKVDRMDSRVDEMEKAPAKAWESTKKTIIDKVVGAVIGFLIAGLVWAAIQAF